MFNSKEFSRGYSAAIKAITKDNNDIIQLAKYHSGIASGDLDPNEFTRGWKAACDDILKNKELFTNVLIKNKEKTMNKEYTDITLIVDRSGSMGECFLQAEHGINEFIKEQAEPDQETKLTLVEFDHEYKCKYNGEPIKNIGKYTLVPRGQTALLDALGKAIYDTGERLRSLPENDRPGLVVVVVVTDGKENCSREFNLDQVKNMITHQQDVYNWKFTFLGANQDAFEVGGQMGFQQNSIANFDVNLAGNAYKSASRNVTRMRKCAANDEIVQSFYTKTEIESMQNK